MLVLYEVKKGLTINLLQGNKSTDELIEKMEDIEKFVIEI
jgi:hypothetical protein